MESKRLRRISHPRLADWSNQPSSGWGSETNDDEHILPYSLHAGKKEEKVRSWLDFALANSVDDNMGIVD